MAWTLLAVSAALLLVSAFLPWARNMPGLLMFSVGEKWAGAAYQKDGYLLLLPTVLAAAWGVVRRSVNAVGLVLLASGVGSALLLVSAVRVEGWAEPGLGWGVALFAFPGVLLAALALAVAWLRTSRLTDHAARWWRRSGALVLVVVAVVAIVGIGYGGRWVAQGRYTDATTDFSALSTVAGRPGQGLWARQYHGHAHLAAGVVLFSRPDPLVEPHFRGPDVTAVAATNGAERWHYTRRDLPFNSVTVSPDGRNVLLLYERTPGWTAVVLDAVTGRIRWQHDFTTLAGHVWTPRGELVVPESGRLHAYALASGRALWSYRPRCDVQEVLDGADGAVLRELCGKGTAERGWVVALDGAGHERWHLAQPRPRAGGVARATSDRVEDVSSGVVYVVWTYLPYQQNRLVAYRRSDGTRLWDVPSDLAPHAVRYKNGARGVVLTSTDRGNRVQLAIRVATTGKPRHTFDCPPGWSVSSSQVQSGRAYLLLTGRAGNRVVVLDLGTGAEVASYPAGPSGGATILDRSLDVRGRVALVDDEGDKAGAVRVIRV